MAGISLFIAHCDIAHTHQRFERQAQLAGVLAWIGRIANFGAGLPVQAQPKLTRCPVGRRQRDHLSFIEWQARRVEGDGRRDPVAQAQGKGLTGAAGMAQRELLHFAARRLHGGGFFDHAPIVAVRRVRRLRQPQAALIGGGGQRHRLAGQGANEFDFETGGAHATDAHVAQAHRAQPFECGPDAVCQQRVADWTGVGAAAIQCIEGLGLSTPTEAIKALTGELAIGV